MSPRVRDVRRQKLYIVFDLQMQQSLARSMALRSPKNLLKLSRSPRIGRLVIANHFNRMVDALAPTTNYPRLKAFFSSNLWPWIWSYLKYAFTPRVCFPTYANSGKNGVYRITPVAGSDAIRIAIAGDWGTGTDTAHAIASLMDDTKPDFTMHLGDVYYVGDKSEIEENCLGKPTNGYDGVKWPKGTEGSFALNGNHEMYANGGPYFQTFLKTLGMKGVAEGQVASFFCLETDYWRIVAIDTGYNSVGIPILSMIPWINQIPFIGGDCHLEQALVEWLRNVVKLKDNPKPTVILSHHQYFSAFPEQNYTKPAKQLAEFFRGQEFVWLWGHEHRLGIYEKASREGIAFYARCVGHGGMPVEMADPDISQAPLALYDTRTHKLDDGTVVGQNGFVNVAIRGDTLTLDYRDIDNISLFVEVFKPGANGALAYSFDNHGILKPPPQ